MCLSLCKINPEKVLCFFFPEVYQYPSLSVFVGVPGGSPNSKDDFVCDSVFLQNLLNQSKADNTKLVCDWLRLVAKMIFTVQVFTNRFRKKTVFGRN